MVFREATDWTRSHRWGDFRVQRCQRETTRKFHGGNLLESAYTEVGKVNVLKLNQ